MPVLLCHHPILHPNLSRLVQMKNQGHRCEQLKLSEQHLPSQEKIRGAHSACVAGALLLVLLRLL